MVFIEQNTCHKITSKKWIIVHFGTIPHYSMFDYVPLDGLRFGYKTGVDFYTI